MGCNFKRGEKILHHLGQQAQHKNLVAGKRDAVLYYVNLQNV